MPRHFVPARLRILVGMWEKGEAIGNIGGGKFQNYFQMEKETGRDDKGLPIRLYPFTQTKEEATPKGLVVIDPAVSFGRPVIRSLGFPTALIAERFNAGETIAEIAADYDAEQGEIEEALRAESQVHAA